MKPVSAFLFLILSASLFAAQNPSTGKFESKIICDGSFGSRAETCDIRVSEGADSSFVEKLKRGLKKKGYTIVDGKSSFRISSTTFGAEAPGYSDLWNLIEIKDENGAKCEISSTTPNESDGKFIPAILKEAWFGPQAIRAAIAMIPECEE